MTQEHKKIITDDITIKGHYNLILQGNFESKGKKNNKPPRRAARQHTWGAFLIFELTSKILLNILQ